jgi:hypothetical protein
VPTIKDFLDADGNIQRHLFPKGTHFPGDKEYNKTDNLFSDIYVAPGIQPVVLGVSLITPKPLLSLTPTLSQLKQASALKRSRLQGPEKRNAGKRVKVSVGASLSGATSQIADVIGETLA